MEPADIHKIQNRILLRDGKQKLALQSWTIGQQKEVKKVKELLSL